MFLMDDKVREMIEKNNSILEIKKMARGQGMITMQEDGILKAMAGITDLEEVERITGKIEF